MSLYRNILVDADREEERDRFYYRQRLTAVPIQPYKHQCLSLTIECDRLLDQFYDGIAFKSRSL